MGFAYDSSYFPTGFNKRYGKLTLKPIKVGRLFKFTNGLIEVPLSCLNIFRAALPWSGGGYFRMLPYGTFYKGIKRIANKQKNYTFYIHPWEFDPEQPRLQDISWKHKFRHYINLNKTKDRFSKLISEFPFEPIKSILNSRPLSKNESSSSLRFQPKRSRSPISN
jgi:hypothetical protein